jgi:hypothetical protein
MQANLEFNAPKDQDDEDKPPLEETSAAPQDEQEHQDPAMLGKGMAGKERLVETLEEERRSLDTARQAFQQEQQRGREELAAQRADLQRESATLEEQVFKLDEYRAKLIEESHRLHQQKLEQDAQEAGLLQSGMVLEDQQAALETVRTALATQQADLLRQQEQLQAQHEDLHRREQQFQVEQAGLCDTEQALKRKQEALQQREDDIAAEQRASDEKRQQLAERSALMDAANDQLRQIQQQLVDEENRLQRWSEQVDERALQLAEAQEQLEAREQAVRDHTLLADQREKDCAVREAEYHRRAAEQAATQEKLNEASQDLQKRGDALQQGRIAFALHEQETRRELEAQQQELDDRAEALERQGAELAEVVAEHRAQTERVLQQRRTLAEERQRFQEEQQRALAQQAEARAGLDALRREAQELLRQLPEPGRCSGADAQRIFQFRDEVRQLFPGVSLRPEQATAATHESPGSGPHSVDTPPPQAANGQELDRPLAKLCAWYRQKLHDLAASLLSASGAGKVAGTSAVVAGQQDDPSGLVPAPCGILNLGPLEEGDQRLGDALRVLQLVDAESLTTLLAEARRQRRSLRQLLLASGTVTLYQLSLIEAGHLPALLLGPLRVIDRVGSTDHELFYRVFDPRRNREALLRHLGEVDARDSTRSIEYQQTFARSILGEPHLAATLEVLAIYDRPAVLQEWLTGLPASDWPTQAAAPGVCFRLLVAAVTGLAAAHRAGLVHGHLSDALLILTSAGSLKVCGIGAPPWLYDASAEEADPRHDLRALGRFVSRWCTPHGVPSGARVKALPAPLVTVLERLTADNAPGYQDAGELLDELERTGSDIPENAEAWDRLLNYVRQHGSAEAILRPVA